MATTDSEVEETENPNIIIHFSVNPTISSILKPVTNFVASHICPLSFRNEIQ